MCWFWLLITLGVAVRPVMVGPADEMTFTVLVAVAVVAVPLVVLGVLRVVLQMPQGDEPHYLAISQALQLYGSLDVAQVYAHGDYSAYYPLPLEPHLSPGPDGRLLPLHSIGGPLLWFLRSRCGAVRASSAS